MFNSIAALFSFAIVLCLIAVIRAGRIPHQEPGEVQTKADFARDWNAIDRDRISAL
jgi:hypothetical protein